MITPRLSRAAAAMVLGIFIWAGHLPGTPTFAQNRPPELRTLHVTALDDGLPVPGLGPDDFVVREDDAIRDVLSAIPSMEPMDVALLVDTSAASQPHLLSLRRGIDAFLSTIDARHRVALITLAGRVSYRVDFTTDRDRLAEVTAGLFSDLGEALTLLDGLVEVSQDLALRSTRPAALVAVVVEGPEFTRFDDRTVLDAIAHARVELHAVTVGRFSTGFQDPYRSRAIVLDRGPRISGGQRLIVNASQALPAVLERLARELSSRYRVVYARPAGLEPSRDILVESPRADVTMRAARDRRED